MRQLGVRRRLPQRIGRGIHLGFLRPGNTIAGYVGAAPGWKAELKRLSARRSLRRLGAYELRQPQHHFAKGLLFFLSAGDGIGLSSCQKDFVERRMCRLGSRLVGGQLRLDVDPLVQAKQGRVAGCRIENRNWMFAANHKGVLVETNLLDVHAPVRRTWSRSATRQELAAGIVLQLLARVVIA